MSDSLSCSGCLCIDIDDKRSIIKVFGENCVFNRSTNITSFKPQLKNTCFANAATSAYLNTVARIPNNEFEIPDFDECVNYIVRNNKHKDGGNCLESIYLLENYFKFGIQAKRLGKENPPSIRDVMTGTHILSYSTSEIGKNCVKEGNLLEKPTGKKTMTSHSVLIEAYNFPLKCLICKNSWQSGAKRFNVRLDALHEFSIIRVFSNADLKKEVLFPLPRFVAELDGQKIHAVYVKEDTATFSSDYVCEESPLLPKDMYIGYDIDEFILIKTGNPNRIEIGGQEIIVQQFDDLKKAEMVEKAKEDVEKLKKETDQAKKDVKKLEKEVDKAKKDAKKLKKEAEQQKAHAKNVEKIAKEEKEKAEKMMLEAKKSKKESEETKETLEILKILMEKQDLTMQKQLAIIEKQEKRMEDLALEVTQMRVDLLRCKEENKSMVKAHAEVLHELQKCREENEEMKENQKLEMVQMRESLQKCQKESDTNRRGREYTEIELRLCKHDLEKAVEEWEKEKKVHEVEKSVLLKEVEDLKEEKKKEGRAGCFGFGPVWSRFSSAKVKATTPSNCLSISCSSFPNLPSCNSTQLDVFEETV